MNSAITDTVELNRIGGFYKARHLEIGRYGCLEIHLEADVDGPGVKW